MELYYKPQEHYSTQTYPPGSIRYAKLPNIQEYPDVRINYRTRSFD
eukprot:IDg20425t1